MTIGYFLQSPLSVLNAMSPYLLLGFLIAGVLHVFVPKRFYARYLSRDNKLSVLCVIAVIAVRCRNRDSIASVAHHRRCV